MSEGSGRRFDDTFDPFDPREKSRDDDREGGPDERAVEDVRAQLGGGDAGDAPSAGGDPQRLGEPEPLSEPEPELKPERDGPPQLPSLRVAAPQSEPESESDAAPRTVAEHAPGHLEIPEGVGAFIGSPNGERRAVGIVVARFNGDLTTRLLRGALETLQGAGVPRSSVDVMQVPGAFELPLGAMALAKTRRYACVLALGCVIRGDTPHFEYVAGEAASGVQLAGLETGVPVAFGVLTCDDRAQAEARAGGPEGNKGSEAAVTALEMADVLARLRSDAGPRS